MASQYLASVVAGTIFVAALSGCNSKDNPGPTKPGSAIEALNQISQKTKEVSSYRLATDINSIDSGTGARLNGHADIRSKPSATQWWTISGTTAAGKQKSDFQEIVSGHSLYLKLPAHVLPTRKPWVRFSQTGAEGMVNILDFAASEKEMADMTQTITILTASKDVRAVGRETVAGTATTHYKGTYSMPDALAKLRAQHLDDSVRFFESMNLGTMTFDLWADGSRLPRKVRMATPDGSKTTLVSVTLYTAFNAPITITVPPRSQVADGAHLAGRNTPGAPT